MRQKIVVVVHLGRPSNASRVRRVDVRMPRRPLAARSNGRLKRNPAGSTNQERGAAIPALLAPGPSVSVISQSATCNSGVTRSAD
jgi:hypothetical protein